MLSPTPFPLSSEQRRVITDAAAAAEPREACGLVAGGRAIELPNVSSGRHSFQVRPEDLVPVVEAAGGWDQVSAIWHSHPGAEASPWPSDADVEAHPVGKVMIITVLGEVYAYGVDASA